MDLFEHKRDILIFSATSEVAESEVNLSYYSHVEERVLFKIGKVSDLLRK